MTSEEKNKDIKVYVTMENEEEIINALRGLQVKIFVGGSKLSRRSKRTAIKDGCYAEYVKKLNNTRNI